MEFTALLTASVLGVTIQQVSKKAYNKKVSGGTFTFTTLSIFFALIIFLITSGGRFNWNPEILPYCFGFAIAYGSASIGSFLAVATGPISITSLMVQYSLIIPTIYGLCIGEPPSPFLYIGLALLFISLFLVNIEKKGAEKKITLKWIIFVGIAFAANGACSTVQTIQQKTFDGAYKSEFMIIALLISIIAIGAAAVIFERKGLAKKVKTGAHWYIICGLANGLVNLFVMMLAKYNPAIVFPVISAGGIVSTALIGIFFYKEKLSVMQMIGMVLGTASIVFLNL